MAFSFSVSDDAQLRIKLDIDLHYPPEKHRPCAPSITSTALSNSIHGFKTNAEYAAKLKAQDDKDINKRVQLLKETQQFMSYLQQKYHLNPSQPKQILLEKVIPRMENNETVYPKIDGLSACFSGSSLKGYTVPFDSNLEDTASSKTVFKNKTPSQCQAIAKTGATPTSSTTNSGFTPLPYESTTSNSKLSNISMSSSELNQIKKPIATPLQKLKPKDQDDPCKFAYNSTCVPDLSPEVTSFQRSNSPLPEIKKTYAGIPATDSVSNSSVETSKSSLNLTLTSDIYKGITPGVTTKKSTSQTSMASTQSASSSFNFPTPSFLIPNGVNLNVNPSPVATTLSATSYASLPTGATTSASERSNAVSLASSQLFPKAKITIPSGLCINESKIHVVAQSPSKSVATGNLQLKNTTFKLKNSKNN